MFVYAFSQYIKRSGPRLEPCETLLSFQTASSSRYKFYEANLFCMGSLLFIHHRHANSLHIQYCLKYNNIINNTISFLYVLISSPSSSSQSKATSNSKVMQSHYYYFFYYYYSLKSISNEVRNLFLSAIII